VKLAHFAFVALIACGPKPPPPAADPGGPLQANRIKGQAASMDSVVYLSPALANAIGVTSTGGRRGETGNLECVARLVNRSDSPLVIQARASFYDVQSLPLDDTTLFQRVNLPPRGEGTVKLQSTNTNAAHYVIEVGELQ
jgi:uncharacterized protein YcfL